MGLLSGFTRSWFGLQLAAVLCLSILSLSCEGGKAPQPQEHTASESQALNANPELPDFAVFARDSAVIREDAKVSGGDVGVREVGTGPFLYQDYELAILGKATVQQNSLADSVFLAQNAIVGDVQTDHLTDQGATLGSVSPFVPMPAFPSISSVSPGSDSVVVAKKQTLTLASGAHGAVSVAQGAILRLSGGLYHFGSLDLGQAARLEAQAPVEVRVAGRVLAGTSSFVGAAAGTSVTAKDIKIEVSAPNGGNGDVNSGPKAALFDTWVELHAVVVVPFGTLVAGPHATAIGALLGRDVDIEQHTNVIFQDGLGQPCSSCDDLNPCTADECLAGVCQHVALAQGTLCLDGDDCNGMETCDGAGTCTGGSPVVCTALDQCHDVGSCDPATGVCSNPAKPDGTSCNDGDACTQTDSCQAGICAGMDPVICSALDQCHDTGTCDTTTGICSNPAKADGTSCNDGDACTQTDSCQAGICAGTDPVICSALDQCHDTGTCDTTTGICSNPAKADGASCDDGNACTQSDRCQAGSCAGANPVTCSASDQCHDPGTCDPATGVCSNPTKADGAACDDNDSCTQTDTCQMGVCAGANPVVCSALDQCHEAGTCDPATGACSNPLKPECEGLPPDPALIAPPLDRSVATTLFDQTRFLFEGQTPIQTGVAPGAIVARQVAWIRSCIETEDGQPLHGVTVTALHHPELGQTLTRIDGKFDFIVNGGDTVILDYQKDGYLPIQRHVPVQWEETASPICAVMIQADPNVSEIAMGAAEMQVAEGSVVIDERGERQAVCAIAAGTQALAILPDGSPVPLNEMHIRITEYTVGPDGVRRMPAELPPESVYTYAVEVSADEAVAIGATTVELSQPAACYVDNFLEMSGGIDVPVGYYDRTCGEWQASENGRVIKVVGVTGGLADLDVTGDDVGDSEATLSSLGITTSEREVLALRYPVGKTLWRARLPHFSTSDWNFGWPPLDAVPPPSCEATLGDSGFVADAASSGCSSDVGVGSVAPMVQAAAKVEPVAGTPYELVYQSDRSPARNERKLVIPITGATVPASLKRVDLEISVAGRTFTQTFPPAADQSYEFEWDGRDAFGRLLQGLQAVHIRVGWAYPLVSYGTPSRFGYRIPEGIEAIVEPLEFTFWCKSSATLETVDQAPLGLGGFSLDVHHWYDAEQQLHLGDGTVRKAEEEPALIERFAGGGTTTAATGVEALKAAFPVGVKSLEAAADGSIYAVTDGGLRVFRIEPNGTLTHVAGTLCSNCLYNGDEIPATQANLFGASVSVASACDGGIYIADQGNHRIRHVDAAGIIHTVAGDGTVPANPADTGDGGPATQAPVSSPTSVAAGPDGSIYFATPFGRVGRVGTDGLMSTAAGRNCFGFDTACQAQIDGVAADETGMMPREVAVGRDGALYVLDRVIPSSLFKTRIRRVGVDGIVETIAGGGSLAPANGVHAVSANISNASSMTVGPDGTVYFTHNGKLWAIGSDGVLRHLAGKACCPLVASGAPAMATAIAPQGDGAVTAGADGALYVVAASPFLFTSSGGVIARIRRPLPGGAAAVPSENGRELYVFSSAGRHLTTRDALTGALRYSFSYDLAGRLASVVDGFGKTTTITRDPAGHPTAVVGPYGQTTALETNADGWLTKITNPAGESLAIAYAPGVPGLATSFTDAAGAVTSFGYDASGRLVSVASPAGGTATLSLEGAGSLEPQRSVTVTTGLGVSTTYEADQSEFDDETRAVTLASGAMATQSTNAAAVTTTALPSGTVTTVADGGDSRFGLLAPFEAAVTIDTPGGLHFNKTTTRSVTVDQANPYVVSFITQSTKDPITNQSYETSYTGSIKKWVRTTPSNRSQSLAIQPSGQLASRQIGTLAAVTFAYDAQGRVKTIQQGTAARQFAYDADGTLGSVTDPLGRVTHYDRDDAGRVTAEILPDGQVVMFGYDAAGRPASLTPPGRPAHTLAFTGLGLLEHYTEPTVDGATPVTSYGYNADGRLASVTRPDGSAVTVSRDAAGRIDGAAFDGGTLALAYDPATGALATATGAGGAAIAYEHDGFLLKEMASTGPVEGTVRWGYDRYFKLVSEGIHVGGMDHVITFGYDADGLMTKAGRLSMTRNTNALLSATAIGGVTETFTLDAAGRRTGFTAKYLATNLISATYTRDALGRFTQKTETTLGQTKTTAYTYDLRGRLTKVTQNGVVQAEYTYDPNGNRITTTTPGGVWTATYDAQDRLEGDGPRTYTYGAGGELLAKTDTITGDVTTFAYDGLGNLEHVVLPDGRAIDYLTDPAGRRIAKTVNGAVVQKWLYRGRRPVAELDGAGNLVLRFVWGDNDTAGGSAVEALLARLGAKRPERIRAEELAVPLYVITATQALRVLTDAIGSPVMLVDADTGAVVATRSYDAWGRVLTETGTWLLPLGFAGGLYDSDTGLVHFGARELDPEVGRWIAKEPMKTAGILNAYEYALGDPVNAADVDGLALIDCANNAVVLDSICGPDGEGALHCSAKEYLSAKGGTLAEGGVPTAAETDGTDFDSGTDLPELDGGGTPGFGGGPATPNASPAITMATTTFTVTMPNALALSPTVTDDGLPAGYPLQMLWYTKQGPAQALFADPTAAATTVTFPAAGTYELVLLVSDAEYVATKTVTVTVIPQNFPPAIVSVTVPATADIAESTLLSAVVTDDGLPAGSTLSSNWSKISGPGTVTFGSSPPTGPVTTATFSAVGTYVLQIEATDGALAVAQQVTIEVIVVNKAPVVNAGADVALEAPAMSTTLSGSATDDGLPAGSTLSYAWSVYGGPEGVTFGSPAAASTTVSFAQPGSYVIRLSVSDGEKTGTDDVNVSVAAPDGAVPVVSIDGLADNATITEPTTIAGTISEGAWTLEMRRGGRDDVTTVWSVLASGVGAASGVLATFDPTRLVNGLYTVRLFSTTTAGSTVTSIATVVEGRMKVGNFTLTFVDLDVPVTGLPIQLLRTYDSRDSTPGDFGAGWTLDIRNVRVEKSGITGKHWSHIANDLGFFTQYCLVPVKAATVTVTLPGGKVYRFNAKSEPECQLLDPITLPDIVWESVSYPAAKLVASGGSSVFAPGPAPGPTELQTSEFEPWDPRQFTFTTEDGTVYLLGQDSGVAQMTDRNGNTLTVSSAGVLSSTGLSITFERDAQHRITKVTDPDGEEMTYSYDANGDLASRTDREGHETTFTYSAGHYLEEIIDPLGRKPIKNVYNAEGRLISSTDALGHTVSYEHVIGTKTEIVTDRLGHNTVYAYNGLGDIVQKTDATGAVYGYSFDSHGNVLTETDPLGKTTVSTYDANDNLLTRTDPLGHTTTYTYNSFRQMLTATDPLGHTTTNVYSFSGNLLTTTDPLGKITIYTYDFNGNRLTETAPTGAVTEWEYDGKGRVKKETDALDHVMTYTYDNNGRRLTETRTRTKADMTVETLVTTNIYDGNGRITQTTYPDGTFTSTTYSPTGKELTRTDELGHVTSYEYDFADKLLKTTGPDGAITTSTYDEEGRRITSTDAMGRTTAYVYDNVGRVTQTTVPGGAVRSTEYDLAGRVRFETDETGFVTERVYDDAGRVVETIDSAGGVTTTAYDVADRVTITTDPNGDATESIYDAAGRVIGMLYADGATTSRTYNEVGWPATRTDELGHVTSYEYDLLGRLVTVEDALGNLTHYGYDEVGNRTFQTDANGNTTLFAFDSRGRELQRTLPDGAFETKVYAADGKLSQRTDFMGQLVTYAHDAAGRVLSRTYPDASVVSFTYWADGRRKTATDESGVTSYAYDVRGRPSSITYPDGRKLEMGYDAAGRRASLTAVVGGQSHTTTYVYDAGRLAEVHDPLGRVTSLDYDPAGMRTGLSYPNGVATNYVHDSRGRLTSIEAKHLITDAVVQSLVYTLDPAGRRTQIAEPAGLVRTYGYDNVDRLTTESVSGGVEPAYSKTFVYDDAGNRMTQATTGAGAGTVAYSYDVRDRLLTEAGQTYGWDANGNLISKQGGATYTWDFENRLIGVTQPDGTVVEHVYDAEGNRVETSVTPPGGPAVVTKYLVDTAGGLSHVVADTTGAGALTALYVRVGDELLAVMRPAGGGTWATRFVHHDAIGSVRVMTDEAGLVTDARSYEAFGTKTVSTGTDPLVYGFAGEAFDNATGLAYHRARWMDPGVGRFIGVDPVDHLGRMGELVNLYSYADSDPANRIDPSGREWSLVSISGVANIVSINAVVATVSTLAKAAAIVCGAQLAASFFAPATWVPKGLCRIRWFNHYTTWDSALKIWASRNILGNPVFVTPDWYFSGSVAKERLALPNPIPPEMFFRIPEGSFTNLQYRGEVTSNVDRAGTPQGGGGQEWTADSPVPINKAVPIPIGP